MEEKVWVWVQSKRNWIDGGAGRDRRIGLSGWMSVVLSFEMMSWPKETDGGRGRIEYSKVGRRRRGQGKGSERIPDRERGLMGGRG